jgi:serine protease Do
MARHLLIAFALGLCLNLPGLAHVNDEGQASLAAFSKDLQAVVRAVGPSVVQINVSGYGLGSASATSTARVFERQQSTGSGVILDSAGFIVTNYHVIAGARRVTVTLAPDRGGPGTSIVRPRGRTLEASVVGVDEETDLAVLKIDAPGLPALTLGDSDQLRPGQVVLAFGSPLGLENSMTMGVVSAVGRQLEADAPMVYIQTDAPINPGNSGGPLLDAEGRVIGINTMILSQSGGNEGLGFAAPSNIVRSIYQQIRKAGRVKRGTIGVQAQTITPTMAAALGLPRESGVILADVIPDQPGALAGLRIGDVVISADGKPMENGRQFEVHLYQRAAGDISTLEVLRDGAATKIQVAIAEREGDPSRLSEMVTPERNLVQRLGILALDLDPTLTAMIGGLRLPGGVLVAARALSTSAQYGLEPADVILSVNGAPVPALADLRRIIARLQENAPCVLQVQRKGQLVYLTFELE